MSFFCSVATFTLSPIISPIPRKEKYKNILISLLFRIMFFNWKRRHPLKSKEFLILAPDWNRSAQYGRALILYCLCRMIVALALVPSTFIYYAIIYFQVDILCTFVFNNHFGKLTILLRDIYCMIGYLRVFYSSIYIWFIYSFIFIYCKYIYYDDVSLHFTLFCFVDCTSFHNSYGLIELLYFYSVSVILRRPRISKLNWLINTPPFYILSLNVCVSVVGSFSCFLGKRLLRPWTTPFRHLTDAFISPD